MRLPTLSLAAALLAMPLLGAPATAQVQQGNPNAANRSLSNTGQMRAIQQGQAAQRDTTTMTGARSQGAAPPPPGGQRMGLPPATGPGR